MINYRKEEDVHPCHLSREDVIRLVQLIKTDFAASTRKEDLEITSHLNQEVVSANSIEDFLGHNNLPAIISRLTIRLTGWSNSKIDKTVNLTFYDNFIQLNVSGDSQSWVNGKFIQINDYLRTKRPFFWFLRTMPAYFIRGAFFFLIIFGAFWMIQTSLKKQMSSTDMLISLCFLFVVVLDTAMSKFRYTQIFIQDRMTFVQKYNSTIILGSFAIAILTLLVAVLQYFR